MSNNYEAVNIINQWEEEILEEAELEALGEICLYRDSNYSLHFDPGNKQVNGFSYNPYVKIYNNGSYTKAKADIRIDLDDGHITTHKDGKKDLKMTNSIANKTSDLINSGICNVGNYSGQKIIDIINNKLDDIYDGNYKHILKTDFSNYYKGTKKKKNDDDYTDFYIIKGKQ